MPNSCIKQPPTFSAGVTEIVMEYRVATLVTAGSGSEIVKLISVGPPMPSLIAKAAAGGGMTVTAPALVMLIELPGTNLLRFSSPTMKRRVFDWPLVKSKPPAVGEIAAAQYAALPVKAKVIEVQIILLF